jgi:hypothetical protein
MERELLLGERVTLGDLVKEAFDLFITSERSNERSNDRMNVRPNVLDSAPQS